MKLGVDGPSEEFSSLLRNLFEVSCANGELRHSRASEVALMKVIAGHSYSKVAFGLCHFLALSSSLAIPLYTWFVLPSRPSSAYFTNYLHSIIVKSSLRSNFTFENKNTIQFRSDNKNYRVNLNYIVRHLALLDLVLEVVGFSKFETFYIELGNSKDLETISSISNKISKLLYDYLKLNFPTQRNQLKAKSMQDFILKHRDASDKQEVCLEDIDDELILSFWLSTSSESNSNFRLYQSCVFSWVNFRKSIRQKLFEYSKSELSLEALNEVGFQLDQEKAIGRYEETSDLRDVEQLLNDLDPKGSRTVKLINGVEFEAVSPMATLGDEASNLMLTVLRLHTFSPIQSRLIEFSRKKKDQVFMEGIIKEIKSSCFDKNLYQIASVKINDINAKLQGIAYSAAYSLFQAKSHSFILILPRIAEKHELEVFSSRIRSEYNDVTLLSVTDKKFETVSNNIFNEAQKIFPQTLEKLKNAKKKFRRKGLDKIPNTGKEKWINELVSGVEILVELVNFIDNFQKNNPLNNQSNGTTLMKKAEENCWFKTDIQIFSEQFSKIYGDN